MMGKARRRVSMMGKARRREGAQGAQFSRLLLIILKLTSSTPELLFIFSWKNVSFNLFIVKGLESIMAFTLLIYFKCFI